MKNLSAITDPHYVPKATFSSYEKFWLKRINDPRDLPFIHLLTTIHLVVILPAFLLYTPLLQGWIWWVAMIPYFYISQLYFKGRFGLMFHCLCHRKMFKKKYQWIHTYLTWFVCPFFGHAPEGYFSHHIGMHHIENNLPDDTSSTMGYQRDSVWSFLRYFLTFLFTGPKNTVLYLYHRRKKKMYERLTMGELFFYIFCIGMCFVNFKATMMIFVVPLLFARLVMMLGNWTQHAFIDTSDPENIYTSSINCINTSYNQMCWNDGYHIVHHLRPGMHYTDMPAEFIKLKDEFAKKKALVFDSLNYLHIFVFLLTKRYDKLADNVVNINNTFSSREEVIAIMKDRTKKMNIKTGK